MASPWSDAASSHPSTPATPSATNISFAHDLANMMHACGECNHPNIECAQIIEKVLHQQLTSMVQEMSQLAIKRQGHPLIGLEEFIFFLRKDFVKLSRLMRYLDVLDNRFAQTVDETSGELPHSSKHNKRRKMALEFIRQIDTAGELESVALNYNSVSDPVKQVRLLRAERQALGMTTESYLKFHTTRQNMFGNPRQLPRLKDWVVQDLGPDVKLTRFGLETLAYFANESLAQIMDLCFIVVDEWKQQSEETEGMREEMKRKSEILTASANWPGPLAAAASTDTNEEPKITPSVLREALRRHQRTTGPFSAFKKEQMKLGKRKFLAV